MKSAPYPVRAKVWLYQGDSPWHFVTIEKEDADEIKKEYIWPKKGFGSIPVSVSIGNTKWNTSIFPDKNSTYLLPIKKEVREKEKIEAGSKIDLSIKVII